MLNQQPELEVNQKVVRSYEKFNIWREKSINSMRKNQVAKQESELSGSDNALLMVSF